MRTTRRNLGRATLGLTGALLLGSGAIPAAAAEPEGASVADKLREQARKILDLMRRNEDALLRLSTGAEAKTTKPDVDIPPPSAPSAPPTGAAPAEGAEAAKSLEELIQAQRGSARRIPGEIEEFIRLIPP
jgi:hypothetical protein